MQGTETRGKRTEWKRDLTTVQGPTKGATSVLAPSQAMNRSDDYRRSFPHAKIGEVFGGKGAVKTSCTFLCLMFIWFPFIGWNWISADMPLSEERDRLTYCKSLGGVFAWMDEKDALAATWKPCTVHNRNCRVVLLQCKCESRACVDTNIIQLLQQYSVNRNSPVLWYLLCRFVKIESETQEGCGKKIIWLRILGMEIRSFSISLSQVQVVGRNEPGATECWYRQGQCQLYFFPQL